MVVLTALIVPGNGTPRQVAASWSSDAPDVVSIDSDGVARGVMLGTTLIHASFGELSAVQPIRVVPDYAGTWKGAYRITNCTQISGSGPSYCRFAIQAVLPFVVTITQRSGTLSGTLEFHSSAGALLESGPVEGSISDSNALVLTATTSSQQSEQPSSTTLSDWNTTLVGVGHMIGHFVNNRHFQNFFGWQDSREDCEIVDLTRAQP
jgi:hypothetical protein